MENKFNLALKIILIFGLGTALIGGFYVAQAYSPHTTHSPLAESSVELYNNFYPQDKLNPQEAEWIVKGAADEDSPFLRPLNHFYDPVNNGGLEGYLSSKEWAHSPKAQAGIGGNYTWEEALSAYKRGDREKAYRALGQIMHLIQDSAVPAHTRNDPHPHGEDLYNGPDPYEQGVKEFGQPSLLGLSPIIYSDIDIYFDRTAHYTNSHFYSKDSIGFYSEPVPVRIDGNYIYGRDDKGEYKLIKYEGKLNTKLFGGNILFYLNDPLVLQDYWSRLAPFAIENGAGVIKLFHDSVYKEVVIHGEEASFWDKTIDFVGNAYDNISSAFGWLDGFRLFATSSNINAKSKANCTDTSVYLGTSPGTCTELEFSVHKNTKEENQKAQDYFYNQLQNTKKQTEIQFSQEISSSSTGAVTPDPAPVEGIESEKPKLYFVTRVIDGDTIELEGGERVRYIGINAPEKPSGCFAEQSTQFNKELVLNKNIRLQKGPTDKDNYGRLLRYIYTEGGILVNETLVQTGHAYAFDYNDPHKFSEKFEKLEEEAREEKRGLWGDVCHPAEGEVKGDSTSTSSFGRGAPYGPRGPGSFQPQLRQQNRIPGADMPDHLLINEVQVADSEFVELYNPTGSSINLEEYYFSYYSSSKAQWQNPWRNKKFPSQAKIEAQSYYLIGLNGYPSDGTLKGADWQPYSSSQLSNSGGSVAIFNYNPKNTQNPKPIDALGWGSDEDIALKETKTAPAPSKGKSISRNEKHVDTDNNFNDFTEQVPTPKNSNLGAIVWENKLQASADRILTDSSSNVYLVSRDSISLVSSEGEHGWENINKERTALRATLSSNEQILYGAECFYVGNRENKCYFFALNAANGEEIIKEIYIGRWVDYGLLVDPLNNNVYVSAPGRLVAFNLNKEKSIAWQKKLDNPVYYFELYNSKLYLLESMSDRSKNLAVLSTDNGSELEYMGLGRKKGKNFAISEGRLFIGYVGSPCGANRENGISVFNLPGMDEESSFIKNFRFGCSGRHTSIKTLNNKAYTVPTNAGLWPDRSLGMFYTDKSENIKLEHLFFLSANHYPASTLYIDEQNNIYLFAHKSDSSGSSLYKLDKTGAMVNSFNFSDTLNDIALSSNRLYTLTNQALTAIDLSKF